MNGVYGYFTIGLLIASGLLITYSPFMPKRPPVFNERPTAQPTDTPTWWVLLMLAAVVLLLMMLLWPFWLGFKVWRWWVPADETPRASEDFAVQLTDLLEPVTLADIEQSGSLSALPLAAWRRFRRRLRRNDTLWTFSTYWKPPHDVQELRAGYVIVRSNRIGPSVLTYQKRLNEEAHRY